MSTDYSRKEKQNFMAKCFAENSRNTRKKICKPVMWDGIRFESITELGKYHKLWPHHKAGSYIRDKKPLNGHIPELIK